MPDIDLIPGDYRAWIAQRRLVRKAAALTIAVNLAVIAAGGLLALATAKADARADGLQAANSITGQQQQQLQQLTDQQAVYEKQWSLLRGLRAGAAIEDVFSLIDRALVADKLWFLEWGFKRAGIVVDGATADAQTGYFVIVSETSNGRASVEFDVETHMRIRGQASDHQALSSFVRALFEEPDVKDVNVQRTGSASYGNGRVVEFDLVIVLQSDYRET